jgi:DNA-binding response OmpR family regulator
MNAPHHRTIVLLDDSEIVLAAAKACLEGAGYVVRATTNLEQLEAALRVGRPDLFVLDVQMPEMYGDHVAQVLREMRNLTVPIILFSDIDETALAERGREAGVQACVAKREGLGALLSQVQALLKTA